MLDQYQKYISELIIASIYPNDLLKVKYKTILERLKLQ